MTSICKRCGGFLVGEQALDYYQTRCWKCVNCGWYRRETQMRSSRSIILMNRRVCK